jgi:predicted AAA+ superfamily ATPase
MQGYYVLSIIGPRQAGKTTLARVIAPDKPYLSLEDPDSRARALHDPRGLLAEFPEGGILDEVQHCPALLSYLQTRVDARRRPGEWLITGSNQFRLQQAAAQSLAGRLGQLTLLPLAWTELQAAGRAPGQWETAVATSHFPALYDRELAPAAWLRDYVATYVERDVRLAHNIQNLAAFQRFLGLCAGRTGQLLNLAALGADAGIDQRTARTWLTLLEASFLVVLLPPWFRNRNRRLVKTPKLYFTDAGLAAWLLGIRETAQLATHPLRGALFETWVVAELLKAAHNRGESPGLCFYRTRDGLEVDLLAETPRGLHAVELKSGATVTDEFFGGFSPLRKDLGAELTACWLVYGGSHAEVRDQARVLPWSEIGRLAAALAIASPPPPVI